MMALHPAQPSAAIPPRVACSEPAALFVIADPIRNPACFFKETEMGFKSLEPGLLLGSAVYTLLGVLMFWLCFLIIDKLTPYNLWEEIVEKQNKALAMVVAAMSLGICIIVAAAIHG